jgi:hypothetical protein
MVRTGIMLPLLLLATLLATAASAASQSLTDSAQRRRRQRSPFHFGREPHVIATTGWRHT